MNTLSNNLFCELELNEQMDMVGGKIYIGPNSPSVKLGIFVVKNIVYDYQVEYVNTFNDTVTSAGRTDLLKPYPEKPTW